MIENKLLSPDEVARLFGESRQWVYRMAREGVLPAVRCSRKVKFSQQAINEFIASGGKGSWRKNA